MKKQTRSITLGLCFTLLISIPTLGSATPISNTPLFTSTAAQPNVFFVVDDSINMEMDQMNADLQAQGQYVISNQDYRFLIPMQSGYYSGVASILPSQQAVTDHNLAAGASSGTESLDAAADGVWRARNAKFNRIYYDPAVTYSAWKGVNNANVAYANITNPGSVPWDPYDAASAVIDLTASVSWTTTVPTVSGSMNTVTVNNYYIPRYYEWSDTNGNGVVDASDSHVWHEIRLTGCSIGATCSSSYTRPLSRTDCATPGTCSAAEELRNFANWWAYHRTRDKVVKATLSEVIEHGQDIRMGLSTTHNNPISRYEIADMNTAALKSGLMGKLFQYRGRSPGSPLKAALERAGNYYACGSGVESNSNHFTYYRSGNTEDSVTMTGNLFENNGCPINSNPDIGRCQQNFTVMITDGFDTDHGTLETWSGDPASPVNGGWSGVVPGTPDNVRLYNNPFGLNTVNADANTSSPFDGAPYADVYSDTLADVAMYFYKTDLSPLANDVPTQSGVDENNQQHMVTFGVAMGRNGTLSDSDNPKSSGFVWPDPSAGNAEKIDDLRHATYNSRGKFFSASDPLQLSSALNNSVQAVTNRTGSASAVAFNTTALSTDTSVYLALFNSTRWSGDVVSYRINPNSGVIDMLPSWSAAYQVDHMAWSTRNFYTWNGTTGANMNSLASLTVAQVADLNMGPSGVSDGLAADRLAYLRGDRSDESGGNFFRERNSRLGDIVHSGPVYVGPPELYWPDAAPFPTGLNDYTHFRAANQGRSGMVLVGANDGGLHIFDAQSGNEKLVYIPSALFSTDPNRGMHYLTDPSYSHQYYTDQTVSVSDIYTGGVWKTVAVGSLGAGGRGIFALDITDINNFTSDKVMGEFNSSVDANLGYSFSKPVIALTNALDSLGANRWAAIFGNGYNSGGKGRPALFVVFLDADLSNGWQMATLPTVNASDDYVRIDVPDNVRYGDTTNPNGVATPAVINAIGSGDGTADIAYAGDLLGNLWGFDLSTWQVRHTIAAGPSAGTKVPLFTAAIDAGLPQAITVRPEIAPHPNGSDYIVLFGTGRYLAQSDVSPASGQRGRVIGVFDKASFSNTLLEADLVNQPISDGVGVDYRWINNATVGPNAKGWKIILNPDERVVTDPVIRGDFVYIDTTIPSSIACDAGGTGWLLSLSVNTGGEPDHPVFDYNNDEIVDAADNVVVPNVGAHNPAGRSFNKGLPSAPTILGDRRFVVGSQTGNGGDVFTDKLENLGGVETGRLSWEQKKRVY